MNHSKLLTTITLTGFTFEQKHIKLDERIADSIRKMSTLNEPVYRCMYIAMRYRTAFPYTGIRIGDISIMIN